MRDWLKICGLVLVMVVIVALMVWLEVISPYTCVRYHYTYNMSCTGGKSSSCSITPVRWCDEYQLKK